MGEMDDDDEDDTNVPTVLVNSQRIPITDVDEDLIATMTTTERDNYIQVYQDYYMNVIE